MLPEVTVRLSEALQKVLKQPEVRAQLLNVGFEGYGMSPAQFGTFFREMHETWVRTVRENNISFEQ
jgi:tripartite-type tricarboxylate transporter receptor subunit TctC